MVLNGYQLEERIKDLEYLNNELKKWHQSDSRHVVNMLLDLQSDIQKHNYMLALIGVKNLITHVNANT